MLLCNTVCFNNLIYNIQSTILLQPLSKCWYILKKLYSGLQIPYASLDLANIIPMPLHIAISAPFSTSFIVTERFYCFKIYRTVQKSFSNSTLSHNNGLHLKSHSLEYSGPFNTYQAAAITAAITKKRRGGPARFGLADILPLPRHYLKKINF